MKKLIALIFTLLPLLLTAQQYNFRTYSVKEGVAQSQVYCLLQDSRGFLWMGTRGGGITRFDGISFKTFTTKDGLPNNYIVSIKEDHNGHLWIGTTNGLCEYNGLQFKTYRITKESDFLVYDISLGVNGILWIGTNKGLLKFEKGTFTNISQIAKDYQLAVNAVCCDAQQDVWYGNANGLFHLVPERGSYRITKNKNIQQINCISKDANQTIWVGTYGNGLWRGNVNSFERIDLGTKYSDAVIWNIAFDRKKSLWLATLSNGVINYNPETQESMALTENEGLSNNHVRCIVQDHSGNYWFGTSGGGLSNYFGKMFTSYDKSNGLGGNYIYSIFNDSKNRTWIGASSMGVSIYDSSRFEVLHAPELMNQKVRAIGEDNYGTIYLGTDGAGLYIYKNNKLEALTKLHHQYIRAIVKDQDGTMWVASAGNGLYEIIPSGRNNGSNLIIKNYNRNDQLLGNRITTLWVDKRNRVWYSTENDGIGYLEKEQVSTFQLSNKNGLPSNTVRCMTADAYGKLWVGTAEGLAEIDVYGNMGVNATYNDQLTSSNIYLLVVDSKQNLMIGSETGLDHLKFDANRKLITVKHYSKGDGFTGIETCQNAVCSNTDGSIWFGTINGLTKYNPSNLVKNENETVTDITDVKLFYNSLASTPYKAFVGDWNAVTNIQLPFTKNHLTFDFIGINFSNPDAVHYKWKLEGFDADWSPASTQRTVTYSNIPSGHYTFKVISCNEDEIWNTKATTVQIEIGTPFWKEWWFIIGTATCLLFIAYRLFKMRVAAIQQKAQAAQNQLMLEKERMELEHQALRLQMNPHFIFNALNSIQSQIGSNNDQNARYYLAKFSKLMRQILDNSRKEYITLKEEIEMQENYLLIEKFCNNNSFEYSIQVDENIESDFIKIPPMLLQPFVENAIKHGMKYLTGKKGMITLRFAVNANELICTVIDNGVGRVKSGELNKQSRESYHKSTALKVTEERLSLLRKNEKTSAIQIIDLYDDTGAASGTQVEVIIPIS